MRTAKRLWLIILGGWLSFQLHAAEIQTIDLKPFVGPSPIEKYDIAWLMPYGRQVIDSTPFQIDGAILLYGSNSLQKSKPARTNVNDIPIDRAFAKLHLLAGAQSVAKDSTPLARILLQYTDGSSAPLTITFGAQVRSWTGSWHEEMTPLTDTNSRIVWRRPSAAVVASDSYLRLFHVTLDNPFPEKTVKSISLASLKANAALMLVAVSTGSTNAEALPDTVPQPQSPFPDLRPRHGDLVAGQGVIKDAEGKPISGAQVQIVAAYELATSDSEADINDSTVGTKTETDATGHFMLPPIPDNRLYRIAVFAPGFGPGFYRGLDPKSDPIELRLSPPKPPIHTAYSVQGRLLGTNGQPVAFASIQSVGVSVGLGKSWGSSDGFPEQIFSDTNGEFIIGREKKFTQVQLSIHASGCAPLTEWFDITNQVQIIKLDGGVLVQGRVLLGEKPLAGLRVGMSGTERSMDNYKGHFQARTDTNGVFRFQHLPANTSWLLYGIITSFKSHGALPARMVYTSAPGQSLDLGDLAVISAFTLSGTIRTRHGEPFPKKIKISLSIEDLWDTQEFTADQTGHFSFSGLYPSRVSLSIGFDNWHIADNNRSLDLWNQYRLVGRLETNKDDFVLTIEPGKYNYGQFNMINGNLPQSDYPEQLPLEGAEPTGSPMITLAGRVVDDQTGQPVTHFKVTPGYQPPARVMPPPPQKNTIQKLLEPLSNKTPARIELPFWLHHQGRLATNGLFSFDFRRLRSQPLIQIQADGYDNFLSSPTSYDNTNLVLRLVKGHGPSGIVLLPNGQPAENASVVFAAAQEQFNLTASNTFNTYGNKEALRATGKDGRFTFSPRAHAQNIFVAHSAGWCEITFEKNPDNLKLQLQPWAAVTGILTTTNGQPVPNHSLCLTAFEAWQQRQAPLVNLDAKTTTDAHGHFFFPQAPPRHLELQRMVPSGGGYSYQLQTPFNAESGITNDLGNVILDTPPPPGTIEKLKKKLGL